jgi:putative copper resistance protein D
LPAQNLRVLDLNHPVRLSDLVLQWRPDWASAALLGVAAALYVRARLRLRGRGGAWPWVRDAGFAVGLLLAFWVTCGFPQARSSQLMWVWTSQILVLLLVVPVLLGAGQPVSLARNAYGEESRLPRLLRSRPVRVLGHPALGLLYVPLATGLLFFGGIGDLTVRSLPASWVLHVVLVVIGIVIALPLVDVDDARTSLAVGAAMAVSAVELLIDAIPGIVLRLETHLEMASFALHRPAWSPSWLADQQSSGTILWTVAELLDLPFIVLAMRQWIRVEHKEARRIDAELDRAALATAEPGAAPAATSRPWWLDDPALRGRYGGS